MRPDPNAYTQARTLLSNHGTVQSQLAGAWIGTIPLPADVARFYEEVGPVDVTIRGYGNPTKLPSLANLWSRQAGYRWNGMTGEPIRDWNKSWLVVASEGGNPYIFDQSSTVVLSARHGQGAWRAERCFPNLPVMASCLATLGSIAKAAGEHFKDEESYVRPEHRQTAIAAIANITGSKAAAARVIGRAGWGEPEFD